VGPSSWPSGANIAALRGALRVGSGGGGGGDTGELPDGLRAAELSARLSY